MIIADFSSGDAVVRTEGLFQWDLGQQLKIIGLSEVTNVSQVHFANNRMRQAIVKRGTYENGALTVDIPNEFLQYGGPIPGRAWVYIYRSDTVGYTVKTVHIPIIERSRPNDYVSPTDPDSQGIVKAAMELLENYQTDLAGKLDDAAGSVETENIHDGAVTTDKLGAGAVTNSKIGSKAVKAVNIDNGAVTLPKLDTGVIDSTLLVRGAAADAKVTGDNIRDFNGAINPVLTTVNGKRIVSTTGEIATQEEYSYIEINAVPGLIISGYTRVSPSIYYGAAFYGSSNEYISGAYNDSSVGDWNYSLTAPENAVKLRISCRTNYLSQFTAKFAEFSTSAIVAINNNADDIKHLSAIENEIYFKADAEVAYNTDVEMTLENGVINKKGTTTYTGDANYRHARIDDLRPNDSYQITGICVNNSNYTYPLLSIIDSANNVISTPYTGANGQVTNFAFTIPENADHMFVNFKIDNPYGLKKGSPMTVPQSIEKFRLEESGLSNFYEEQNRRALYNLSFNAPFVWLPFDKAYISWNNDDARSDMPLYKAVCDTYGVPYGNAVPYEKIARNPTIGDTPLIEYLQSIIANGGEVFSHALTWLTANATNQDFYHQFITAKRTLETALGREINGIIQAGGSGYSGADYHKCQEYSISYYQFSDGYGVTPQYTLTRTRFLRSSYSSDAEQVNAYKAAIDDAVTNHKWLRLWCHGTDEVSIDVLTQVFQYAQTYIDRGLLSFTTWQNMYDTFRSHT